MFKKDEEGREIFIHGGSFLDDKRWSLHDAREDIKKEKCTNCQEECELYTSYFVSDKTNKVYCSWECLIEDVTKNLLKKLGLISSDEKGVKNDK